MATLLCILQIPRSERRECNVIKLMAFLSHGGMAATRASSLSWISSFLKRKWGWHPNTTAQGFDWFCILVPGSFASLLIHSTYAGQSSVQVISQWCSMGLECPSSRLVRPSRNQWNVSGHCQWPSFPTFSNQNNKKGMDIYLVIRATFPNCISGTETLQ